MNVELVSLRNSINKKRRFDVVSDIINQSESDIVLFCGHTVLIGMIVSNCQAE